MTLGLIWAQAANGVIGLDGALPWHLPEDMAHFRTLTAGATMIMGRKTWDSLPARFRPLPGRRNLVLTRQTGWRAEGAEVFASLAEALAAAAGADVWVMGGAAVYAEALPLADRVVVTELAEAFDGDVSAPEVHRPVLAATDWAESSTGLHYRWVTYGG
ncbi:dihydrofolate reductase [Longispora fulva]|uniref:Dihydrofolate reductase n=1 Tax=Longispora fulva TaxID=619741 RepID=A0A8J7KQ21_9ACTN|nr:dihydrofolate reductase [Longispora fulva]MBG6136932.1 dihydrofolate reductase [Longispora fulva]GIG61715.1 dihydrofolate reductase [Longispora fulva]